MHRVLGVVHPPFGCSRFGIEQTTPTLDGPGKQHKIGPEKLDCHGSQNRRLGGQVLPSRNEKDTGCGEPAKDQHQADEEHRIPAGTFALARHACGLRLEHPRYAQWNPAHVGEPGSVLIAAQLPRAAAKGNSPSAVTPPVWGAALRVLADAAIAAKEGHHDRST
jgi:hypothetical protein